MSRPHGKRDGLCITSDKDTMNISIPDGEFFVHIIKTIVGAGLAPALVSGNRKGCPYNCI